MPVKTKAKAEESATPITMRIDERVIEQLKLKARRLSFERNKDVSYVDLIRDAVSSTYSISVDTTFNDLADFCIENESETREFWTAETIAEFNASKTGKMIAKCVYDGNYAPYVAMYREKLKDWFYNRSAAFQIMEKTSGKEGECRISRDLASVAFVLNRRGAVPDQLMEGEEIWVPSFEIAVHPTIKIPEIKPHLLFDVMVKPIIAIQKELDTNVFNALNGAATAKKDQIVEAYGGVTSSSILQAFKLLARHYLVPNVIIMHSDQYIDMASFGKDYLSAPPLKEALETKQYGTVHGVSIIVSNRMETGRIIVTPQKKALGVVFVKNEPRVTHRSDDLKRRETFVACVEVGIAICNDWGVAVIETEMPKSKPQCIKVPDSAFVKD